MSRTPIEQFAHVNCYPMAAQLDDGTAVFVTRTIFAGQIGKAEGVDRADGVIDRWSYETMAEAVRAFVVWHSNGFVDEPLGWVRHQPSNRRRSYDNGPTDPFDEWVAP